MAHKKKNKQTHAPSTPAVYGRIQDLGDLKVQLSKQLGFIESSCLLYDLGHVDEGIRIGQAIRVIFHHTGNSTSILSHLASTTIGVFSSCAPVPPNYLLGFWPGLVQTQITFENRSVLAVPKFFATPQYHRTMPASAWWDGEVIYTAGQSRYKRRTVVLNAANKDGGSHVDIDTIPIEYERLKENSGFSTTFESESSHPHVVFMKNAHLASLRQMGYELLRSEKLLELAGYTPAKT